MLHAAVKHADQTLHSRWILATLLGLASLASSCGRRETKAAEEPAQPAGTAVAQRTFASPQAAGAALFEAAKTGDQDALMAIFGPDAKDLITSGDAVKDRNTVRRFVAAYSQMNRWSTNKAGKEILFIGAENFPFPIPLEQNSSGQWRFDTSAGRKKFWLGASEMAS